MKKLGLNVDSLRVDSFHTDARATERGTVDAFMVSTGKNTCFCTSPCTSVNVGCFCTEQC